MSWLERWRDQTATRVLPHRALRLRIPVTAVTIFAVSLGVVSVVAYSLLIRDAQQDLDVVIAREQNRFVTSISELLEESQRESPDLTDEEAVEAAVSRYLELNPGSEQYWTIVTLPDGRRLATDVGPSSLVASLREGAIPSSTPDTYETIDAGATIGEIRALTQTITVDGVDRGQLQILAPFEPERDEAREAALLVAGSTAIALLIGAALLAGSLWRALTPLVQLAATARSTQLRTLDQRVDVPDTRDEVGILAREFNTMLDRIDEAAKGQQRFMASIGHELRTPITIARGHLELLQTLGAGDGAALTEAVDIVRDELGRMGRLVEDLMAIARAEMEDFCRPRALDLVGWFEELELRLAATTLATGVRIEPPPPVVLQADPDRLAQAVLNLVSNARQHTPDGTIIRVFAEAGPPPSDPGQTSQVTPADGGHGQRGSDGPHADGSGATVRLHVVDDGPGIDPELQRTVFEPFVRASHAPTSTGLGLSVVTAVVEAHRGRVELASDSDGTRVTLVLPWTPDDPRDHELPDGPVVDADQEGTQPLPVADVPTLPTLRMRR
ncbi:MAG: HAMP domain-containing histidine kinase [Nitriliruptoraceae bacterium]|nr:HAMP domain-containing histidine kinase [Nitriliruptoraceae bacterium]